jgi:hypothetical protein
MQLHAGASDTQQLPWHALQTATHMGLHCTAETKLSVLRSACNAPGQASEVRKT